MVELLEQSDLAYRVEKVENDLLRAIKLLKKYSDDKFSELSVKPSPAPIGFIKKQVKAETDVLVKRFREELSRQLVGIAKPIKRWLESMRKEIEDLKRKKVVKLKEDYINKIIDKRIEEIKLKTDDTYTTRTIVETDMTIDSRKNVAGKTGYGSISQVLLITDSNDYSLYMLVDDYVLYDQSFEFFSAHSDFLEGVSAFLDAGKYHLSIRNVPFQKKFSIFLVPNNSVLFHTVYVKYNIREEKTLVEQQ